MELSTADALERAWRQERVKVLATVARRTRDLALAEDAVQDAFAAAWARWPVDGVPDRPGAWLTTTAWRKAIGVLRRERRSVPIDDAHLLSPADSEPPARSDDVLGLILACCHPALTVESRVALTLRHVAGLEVSEVAAGFLVSESTMTKRLVRARAKIRHAGISFEPPSDAALVERLNEVRVVISLVFTEGHTASGAGEPLRLDLCEDAIWLARQLLHLLPDDAETLGLLALLLVQHSRREARLSDDGQLVPFDEQARSTWDQAAIDEARALLARTARGPLGPYQLQAAIALLHATADSSGAHWVRVAELYGILERLDPSPVVSLNRAVAIGRADGPQAGLAALAAVEATGRLDAYVPLHAARADLLERAGRLAEARAAWSHAAEICANPTQRAALLRRAG